METSQEQSPPNGRSTTDHGARTLGQKVDHVSDSAQQAWSRTRDAVSDLRSTLDIEGRVNRYPYGTVAAALGIGYVLGGGIFSPLTARILGIGLKVGLRLAVLPFLSDELMGMAEQLGRGHDGAGEEGEGGRGGRKASKANVNKGKQP
jgi:hypothetical protein